MAELNVNIDKLKLKNPIMTASGTFGYGLEFQDFVTLEDIGGIIVKGTTFDSRQGNDYPRMAETASGMLNCVGLQNKGVDYFCKHIYPEIKDIDTNFIVNVSGSSPENSGECAAQHAAIHVLAACHSGLEGDRCLPVWHCHGVVVNRRGNGVIKVIVVRWVAGIGLHLQLIAVAGAQQVADPAVVKTLTRVLAADQRKAALAASEGDTHPIGSAVHDDTLSHSAHLPLKLTPRRAVSTAMAGCITLPIWARSPS